MTTCVLDLLLRIGSLLDAIKMSLFAFRTMCLDLRQVPSETAMIAKILNKKELVNFLSTAMNALTVAEDIIAKQADVILDSTHDSYHREKRIVECTDPLAASTPKGTSGNTCSILNVGTSSVENAPLDSSSTKPIKKSTTKTESMDRVPIDSFRDQPTKRSSAPETASTVIVGNKCCDRSTGSDEDFRVVEARAHKRRRRTRKVVTGCKPGIILGSCYKKMDIFLSRMGPDVSAKEVQDFCKNLLNDWCEVEILKSKFPALYSSFRITCYSRHKDTILDPNRWETGAIIRQFFR